MQVEVGNIVEGKVTGITHFGAFVTFSGGQTGMVHISEISNSYVKEIRDYVQENQEVKVKVLSIDDDNKISLSMKKCEPVATKNEEGNDNRRTQRPQRRRNSGPKGIQWEPKPQNNPKEMSFEDMMSQFKQSSNDRQSELKRANDPRGSRRNTQR